ncbi:MAG TPA: hypothetical protein VE201_05560 [Nitrospirales bacterium]|nr:hypothetical protein [Nitrospirales bacterium]
MPSKKKRAQRRLARKTPSGKKRQAVSTCPAKTDDRRLAEISETLDIMLPELTARIAAVEHLLVEKEICAREELIEAREFVDERPRGGFAGEEQD